jgi:hypothetical protein
MPLRMLNMRRLVVAVHFAGLTSVPRQFAGSYVRLAPMMLQFVEGQAQW